MKSKMECRVGFEPTRGQLALEVLQTSAFSLSTNDTFQIGACIAGIYSAVS